MTTLSSAMPVNDVAHYNEIMAGNVQGFERFLEKALGGDSAANVRVLSQLKDARLHILATLNDNDPGVASFLQRRLKYVALNCVDLCLHHCLTETLQLHERSLFTPMLGFGMYQMHQISNNLINDSKTGEAERLACETAQTQLRRLQMMALQCTRVPNLQVSPAIQNSLRKYVLLSCNIPLSRVGNLRCARLPVLCAVYGRYAAFESSSDLCVQTMLTMPLTMRTMLEQQLAADEQHRIISPLVYRHLRNLVRNTKDDEQTTRAKTEAVQVFTPALRNWASVAMGLETAEDSTLNFLQQPEAHGTGYVATALQELNLKLMNESMSSHVKLKKRAYCDVDA